MKYIMLKKRVYNKKRNNSGRILIIDSEISSYNCPIEEKTLSKIYVFPIMVIKITMSKKFEIE
jgi:hypothetical protein